MASAKDKDPKEVVVLHIRTTRKAGFRRAGLSIPQKGIEVPKDELTKEQIKALYEEPLILVSEVARGVAE